MNQENNELQSSIKVEFNEQSKGVTATVKVELNKTITTDEELRLFGDQALTEANRLFLKAFQQSQAWSLRKQ